MLRLNKLTDYAVVILAKMSADPAKRFNTAELAVQTAVPEPTVAKILKELARSELVESFRGAAGGYQMLREGANVTVREVIEAMEGSIRMVECLEAHSECCTTQKKCPLRGKWDPVNLAIVKALDGITLADLWNAQPQQFLQIAESAA
jgi:FeS assembly SUF system regulator